MMRALIAAVCLVLLADGAAAQTPPDTTAPPAEPVARRPKEFWRGYDVYDQKRMGFEFDTAEAKRVGTRHDVAAKGGGNQGHEYGVELSEADKEALIEYLKTL